MYKLFYNCFGKNVLNKQLWWYVFVICKVELMSIFSYWLVHCIYSTDLVTSSLCLFNRFFVEKMM